MSAETIELLLTRTDRECSNCGALLYRVMQVQKTGPRTQDGHVLGLTCRSCEANGMRLLKGEKL